MKFLPVPDVTHVPREWWDLLVRWQIRKTFANIIGKIAASIGKDHASRLSFQKPCISSIAWLTAGPGDHQFNKCKACHTLFYCAFNHFLGPVWSSSGKHRLFLLLGPGLRGRGRVLKWAPFLFCYIYYYSANPARSCYKLALLRRWLVDSDHVSFSNLTLSSVNLQPYLNFWCPSRAVQNCW